MRAGSFFFPLLIGFNLNAAPSKDDFLQENFDDQNSLYGVNPNSSGNFSTKQPLNTKDPRQQQISSQGAQRAEDAESEEQAQTPETKKNKSKKSLSRKGIPESEILERQFDDSGKLNPISPNTEQKSKNRSTSTKHIQKSKIDSAAEEELQDTEEISTDEEFYLQKSSETESDESSKDETQTKRMLKDEFEDPNASDIESVFLGRFPQELVRNLRQFGYGTFKQRSSNFKIPADAPVGPDYIVGPGDEFLLNTWGSYNSNQSLLIKNDGSVFIPKVGSIQIGGLSLKDASEVIRKKMSASFNGIKLNLSVEKSRVIQVFVVGEVEAPGSYPLRASAGVVNALVAAGGPKKDGSLRNVQIVRNGKTILTLDLYDFLNSGKVPVSPLLSQDVVLVPVVGKLAAVAGGVRRPGIYEILDDTTVFDMLALTGGLSFTGHAGRLSMERVLSNRERTTQDFQIPVNMQDITREDALKGDLGAKVSDGDLIKIFPVFPQINKTVYLRGHVRRPGNYQFKEGMMLSEALTSFEDLLPDPYTRYVQILRILPPKDEKISLFTNLEGLLSGDKAYDVALQDRDEIVVFSKAELDLKERVTITGKVNKPGDYYYFPGMHLRDLIFMAGNLTRDANIASAEIGRSSFNGNDIKVDRLQVNLKEVLADPPLNNPELKPLDRIFIQGVQNFQVNNSITLRGQVKYPGVYSFVPGERLSAVLKRAGGYTPHAFLSGAVFTRQQVRNLQKRNLKEQVDRLESAILQEEVNPARFQSAEDRAATQASVASRRALLHNLRNSEVSGRMVIRLSDLDQFTGSQWDFALEPGDALNIPLIPSSVNVMGEVFNQTSLVFIPDKTVQYYLDQSGGPTLYADTSSIFIIKADGTVASRQQSRGFLLRNFYQMEIERGDAILVPKDITRFSWLNATKDISEILFHLATTTLAITAIAK